MISRVILVFFLLLIWLKCDPLPNYAIVVLLQDDDLIVGMIHHILPQVLFSFYLEGLGRGALTSGSKQVGGHGVLLDDLRVCNNSLLVLNLSSFEWEESLGAAGPSDYPIIPEYNSLPTRRCHPCHLLLQASGGIRALQKGGSPLFGLRGSERGPRHHGRLMRLLRPQANLRW